MDIWEEKIAKDIKAALAVLKDVKILGMLEDFLDITSC